MEFGLFGQVRRPFGRYSGNGGEYVGGLIEDQAHQNKVRGLLSFERGQLYKALREVTVKPSPQK